MAGAPLHFPDPRPFSSRWQRSPLTLAFNRIKANITGAGVGLCGLLIPLPSHMWSISMALCITLTLCYLLKLNAAARSALAATIIIMLHEEGKHVWDTALYRVIAVLAGCTLGIVITFIFHFKTTTEKKEAGNHNEEA